MVGEKTWEKRRSIDVGVFGGDDKRSITACVFSSADGALFPLQLTFQGTTKRVLPKTCGAQSRFESWLSFYHDQQPLVKS
jgi:hypothetical protein